MIANTVQIGLDVAEGGDQTVAAVRQDKRIAEIAIWSEPNLMVTVDKVRAVADRHGVTPKRAADWGVPGIEASGRIVIDAIGVGAGVGSRLHQLGYSVVSFRGNASAPSRRGPHDMEFGNLRAAGYWRLRELLEKEAIDLPPDARLREEILASCYLVNHNGRLYVEDKGELRKRLGRSPDRCDAVVLACWEKPHKVSGLGTVGQW